MYCEKCGTYNEDNALFCANCGASTAAPAVDTVATPEAVPAAEKPKMSKGLIIGLAAGGGALMLTFFCVLIVVCVLLFSNSYKKVAEKAAVAYYNDDLKTMMKYAAVHADEMLDDYFDYRYYEYGDNMYDIYEEFEDDYDVYVESVDDMLEAYKENTVEWMENRYGEYTVTAKAIDSHEISTRKIDETIEEYADELDDWYDGYMEDLYDYLRSENIKKAYVVEVKVTIDGEYETESDIVEMIMVKCGTSWKVLNEDFVFAFDYVF